MEKRSLEIGDVVQLTDPANPVFKGTFMVVTDPKGWGAMGYVPCWTNDDVPKPAQAYYRASWAEMEWVGKAPLMALSAEDDPGPEWELEHHA